MAFRMFSQEEKNKSKNACDENEIVKFSKDECIAYFIQASAHTFESNAHFINSKLLENLFLSHDNVFGEKGRSLAGTASWEVIPKQNKIVFTVPDLTKDMAQDLQSRFQDWEKSNYISHINCGNYKAEEKAITIKLSHFNATDLKTIMEPLMPKFGNFFGAR